MLIKNKMLINSFFKQGPFPVLVVTVPPLVQYTDSHPTHRTDYGQYVPPLVRVAPQVKTTVGEVTLW